MNEQLMNWLLRFSLATAPKLIGVTCDSHLASPRAASPLIASAAAAVRLDKELRRQHGATFVRAHPSPAEQHFKANQPERRHFRR